MTTPHLADDIGRDEGCVLSAYPDPLSGGDPWTIGYGHTGPEVHEGLNWTQARADEVRALDIGKVVRRLDLDLAWWRALNDPRQDVLVNMGFNLGVDGLLAFKNTLRAVSDGRWDAAAAGMLASKWAAQVKGRARRLAEQMRTGVRA